MTLQTVKDLKKVGQGVVKFIGGKPQSQQIVIPQKSGNMPLVRIEVFAPSQKVQSQGNPNIKFLKKKPIKPMSMFTGKF